MRAFHALANHMEGLLGLDAPDNEKNYLVIDLHQQKEGFDLTRARILAVQCQYTGAIFTISSVYLLKEAQPVVLGVLFPAKGAPTAGVKVYGSFTDEPLDMEAVSTGYYMHTSIMAYADDTFSFVDAADPENKLYQINYIGDWYPAEYSFGGAWKDDTWQSAPVKWIEIDLSDTSVYNWANALTDGVDDITADVKAVKVLRNGQIIIEQNGKSFNLLGTEVR